MWRGTMVLKVAEQPPEPLTFYEFEASPECRAVREVLTALHLDADIRPCPAGGKRFSAEAEKISGADSVPVLVDANADLVLTSADKIVAHLFKIYGHMRVPFMYRSGLAKPVLSSLASAVRSSRGSRARPSRNPKNPLHLWSFESSPYSRLVRERLSELELPYRLHNLGKEHWQEVGPAVRRLQPNPYVPREGGKRHAFWLKHKRVQLPYLEDPNQQVELFESTAIVDYIEEQYAL